jgi:hypothetical protein
VPWSSERTWLEHARRRWRKVIRLVVDHRENAADPEQCPVDLNRRGATMLGVVATSV